MTTRRRRPDDKVAKALAPYRRRLIDDSYAFTAASLTLAAANAAGSGTLNELTPEGTAALAALATWQEDVQQAQTRVAAVPSTSRGQKLAAQWLAALTAALGFVNQSLSLMDPALSAAAATSAQQSFQASYKLEANLDRVVA
jgi:hypothetical protein